MVSIWTDYNYRAKARSDEIIFQSLIKYRFGDITGKYVIYRGESRDVEGIQYVNGEE